MGNSSGKYIIGLTGNIATGKSVVRRMLEHLGAYTIDADALAHRAISKGAPGYQPVIETFGKWIIDKDDQIDRSRLAELVFRDVDALSKLEAIIHPLVTEATKLLTRRASQKVVVIEAIKLLESELRSMCDSIWVTFAPEDIQIERLIRKRSLSRKEALKRIHAQAPQEEKTKLANTVIQNTGSYDGLWKQVATAWKEVSPISDTMPVIFKKAKGGKYAVQRGRPRDAKAISEFITSTGKDKKKVSTADVMEAFGEKAFLLLLDGDNLIGLAGWQVENLVARTSDLIISPENMNDKALVTLVQEIERASKDLQCEASLIFQLPEFVIFKNAWKKLGYEECTPKDLGIRAWQDAAKESRPPGTTLMFKQLRTDRVLRPI